MGALAPQEHNPGETPTLYFRRGVQDGDIKGAQPERLGPNPVQQVDGLGAANARHHDAALPVGATCHQGV